MGIQIAPHAVEVISEEEQSFFPTQELKLGNLDKWQPTPVCLPRKSHGQRSQGQATVHGVAKSQTSLSFFHFNLDENQES